MRRIHVQYWDFEFPNAIISWLLQNYISEEEEQTGFSERVLHIHIPRIYIYI